MKIYILVLCLIIIFLKYRLSQKKESQKKSIRNKMIKCFNVCSIPFVVIIMTVTFNEDFFDLVKNQESTVYIYVYTEPADF